jgi:hypothetical protein
MTNAYDVPLPKFSLGRIVMTEKRFAHVNSLAWSS